MFLVYKNNRKAIRTPFQTYEAARQAVRKRLRKMISERHSGQPALPMWSLGYEIRKV